MVDSSLPTITNSDIIEIWAPLATLQVTQGFQIHGVVITRHDDLDDHVKSFSYKVVEDDEANENVIFNLTKACEKLEWDLTKE